MTVADLWEFILKYTNNNNPFAFSNAYYGDTAGCGDQNDWGNVAHCTGSSSTGCNIPGPCARNKCRRASSDRLTLPRSAHATCNCFPFAEKLPIIHLQMPATHLLSPNDNRVSSQANDEFYSGVYDI